MAHISMQLFSSFERKIKLPFLGNYKCSSNEIRYVDSGNSLSKIKKILKRFVYFVRVFEIAFNK